MRDQITYWDYLQIEQLLQLQNGLDQTDVENTDELHFIIVHQVFELWFKLVIAELRLVRDKMARPKIKEDLIPFIVHHLKRVNTILDLAGKHFKLMETLPPQDFLEFREKLGTASGFQSVQLREIELLLGLQLKERKAQGHGDPLDYILETGKNSTYGKSLIQKIAIVKQEMSLREALLDWLFRTPIHGSSPSDEADVSIVSNFIEEYLSTVKSMNDTQLASLINDGGNPETLTRQFEGSLNQAREFLNGTDYDESERDRIRRVRAAILFIESYRELPLLAWPRLLIDTIVEMEELFLGFRFHHARMVERIIGRRIGSGGSLGVDYLDQTTKYRIFSELWAVRTMLLSKNRIPVLQNKDFYSFVTDTDHE